MSALIFMRLLRERSSETGSIHPICYNQRASRQKHHLVAASPAPCRACSNGLVSGRICWPSSLAGESFVFFGGVLINSIY